MERKYHVYIMTNKYHTTLYTGVTSSIKHRVWQHKNKTADGFTRKYNCTKLVYVEEFDDIGYAIQREKNIKAWQRSWKNEAIEKLNPAWDDLYKQLL